MVTRARDHKGWGSPGLAATGIRGHKKCPAGTRRSAPREALDPGEGEAMLGQALHDHILPRDYPRGETAAIFAHEQSC